ncbi:peptidoglycan recognition protein family protein [Kitasatospora sp. NBC_01266]|uniref:peptidoglycan recognition protein family protein n=1 Tax=Kitasatospora sp. NBC_01266 TaxID=2903572 RepID=UPI002E2FE6FD|nr:peptidoglycan-binding domain-containing protein [Kitasatospora sp. NBC_01266]
MARMLGAEWIGPTPNQYTGGQQEVRGLVLHIQQGTEAGSEAWFKTAAAQASAHFLNPKAGGLRQLVDTADAAWAEMAGNRQWISVENEGVSGDSLTASQLENAAQLYAWLHGEYGVPLQATDDPNGQGLGWHGMGGDAWGGHPDCPGDPIKAQRAAILARAQQILTPTAVPAPQPAPAPAPAPAGPPWPGEYLRLQPTMLHDANVRTWQQRMSDRGWALTVDGWYGQQSQTVCRQFQQEKGLTVDGIVGPQTWTAAWADPITH